MNNTQACHGLWIWLYLGFAYMARDCKSEINVSHKTERFRIWATSQLLTLSSLSLAILWLTKWYKTRTHTFHSTDNPWIQSNHAYRFQVSFEKSQSTTTSISPFWQDELCSVFSRVLVSHSCSESPIKPNNTCMLCHPQTPLKLEASSPLTDFHCYSSDWA